MPLDAAITQFKHIHWLNLGMESRGDWVANILLYIPLAFLLSGSASRFKSAAIRGLATFLALCFCLSLAIAIEFTQLFFPPRTVSLNDLIAEMLGTGLGILIWLSLGRYFLSLYQRLSVGGFASVNAAIIFYVLSYLALSFFPFDFVTSLDELELKLASSGDAVIMSQAACDEDVIRCWVKLLVESLVLLPLGMLLAMQPFRPHKVLSAALTGLLLGLIIETVQLFLVSGVAQGISIFIRSIGMAAGSLLWQWANTQHFDDWRKRLKPLVLLSMPFYIALIAVINGFTQGTWLSLEQAMTKLAQTHFLPLYYFYYTSETTALISLLSNIGTYLPIGLAYWIWSLTAANTKQAHWSVVGLSATVLATVIETGKLFLVDKHPDPTDVLIAFIAAAGSYLFLQRLNVQCNKPAVSLANRQSSIDDDTISWRRGFALIVLVLLAYALLKYPLGSLWLAGFLTTYFYLLLRFPAAWLIAIPALLPIMDFTPWTGRLFFNEFDLLLTTTLAASYWSSVNNTETPLFSKFTWSVLWAFILVYTLSVLRGLLPLQAIDTNTFTNYYSNYNSLRLAKGLLWALLLLPLLKRTAYDQAKTYLTVGILIGLSGVIVIAIMERLLFPGLLNFSTDYRITAMFSSMHIGGGHIDAYLALSLPLIALLLLDSVLMVNILGGALFIAGFYVLLVTFSRGAYVALFVSLLVLLGGWINLKYKRGRKHILILVAIVPIIAVPIFLGDFMQQRLSTISKDLQNRISHWQDTLLIRDDSMTTQLIGMGLGSYPRTYLWQAIANKQPATYSIETEQHNHYLKLGTGNALYLGQYIHLEPQTQYRLAADLRNDYESVTVNVPICEKSLLYSFKCINKVLTKKASPGHWEHVERVVDSRELIAEGKYTLRPIQLALTNTNNARVIDIDNVSLLDTSGDNLLANGDFEQGTDFWFVNTDDHQSGNIDNLWVQLLFEQGWLGIIAFVMLMIRTILKLCTTLSYDNIAVVLLSSLAGFFIVALTTSPFDSPRVATLFFLLVFVALREQPDKDTKRQ